MSDDKSGTRSNVGLLDIATKLPGLLMDAPVIVRGVITGFGARPTAKTSIGKVFQERAARYGDKLFIKFEGQQLTYREANETVNRYAAVLAARGVGHGDVVGVMLRNSPHSVLLMLAVVKCGAVAGMLNYHQRGKVLAHSIGLLGAKTVVAETDFIEPISESEADTNGLMTLDELQQLSASAPATNPATTAAVLAKDKAFYIFTSGTTGMPKASVMTHYRWLRALAGFGGLGMRLTTDDTLYCCLPLYHNNALTVALSSVLNSGSTLALGKSFSASKFWDDVIRYDATAFVYIGEICAYLLNQPPKPTDRK
ncbi:MAG: fatty-acyl-CoA synthase, partial [Mycobacterium sp.]|nr:fatty-acyl-CoA synthase [Mycobacterium sp.]